MRDLLFRAKRKDNKGWVEGLLTIMWGQYHIIKPPDENIAYPIDPETVCQYTGLTDKNGRKIFEGDIVSAPFTRYSGETIERKGVVEFANGAFSVNWNDSGEYGKNFVGYVNDIEVIGNIFDNPELIGDQP